MIDPARPPFTSLAEALPQEVAGSGHTWFTRYRRYPVFSPAWARGRAAVWSVCAAPVLMLAMLPMVDRELQEIPLGGLLQVAVQLFAPILLGPWLGSLVRRRHGPAAREWWALVLAMAALAGALLAFHTWAAEPMKQWVAEQTGAVDENGQRRRIIMALGFSVQSPDDANEAPPLPNADAKKAESSGTALINTLSSTLLTLWLGGALGLWGWHRERAALAALARERELSRAQAQRREAELRLSVLAAQVEPHFLFNTLAGVRSAISTDPVRASDMIDRLVDYLRAAIPRLRSDGGAAATLGSQLDIVRAYLGLMQARMPRLSYRIDAPEDLLDSACPPLMLISLAENAVKHGAEPKIGPVQVTVQAQRTADGQLAITVADDGAGFDAQAGGAGGGLGLSNIRERLRQMHGEQASLSLRARPEGGVAATLLLPLQVLPPDPSPLEQTP